MGWDEMGLVVLVVCLVGNGARRAVLRNVSEGGTLSWVRGKL